jgi:hypothetical protein
VHLSTQTSRLHAGNDRWWLQRSSTSYSSGLQLPRKFQRGFVLEIQNLE